MSDTTMTQTQTDNAKPATTPKVGEVHATLEAAKAAQPTVTTKAKPKLYRVSGGGKAARFTWAFDPGHALRTVAAADGYAATPAQPKGGAVTQEAVISHLATLSDEQLAELGLSRKKGRK